MRSLVRLFRFGCSSFRPINSDQSFQSRHYVPRISVEEFLSKQNVAYKVSPTGYRIKQCPFCQKPHNNQMTNMYTLNVHKDTGMFFCFRCASKGSWMDFRGRMLGISDGVSHMFGQNSNEQNTQQSISQQSFTEVEYFLYYQNIKNEDYKDVMVYLTNDRGLKVETIEKYKLGTGIEKFSDEIGDMISIKVVYFPMFRLYSQKERKQHQKELHDYISIKYGDSADSQQIGNFNTNRVNSSFACLSKMKVRGVGSENKKYMRQHPPGNRPGMFGLNLISPSTKEVVITEGQYDAMSVFQQTGIPSLSLPQGANNLPDNILPYLDNVEKIYLWMDNDEVGQMNAPKVASKLGIKRCFIVENLDRKLKDANDVLRHDKTLIKTLLSKAKTIPGQSILNFENIEDKVRNRILNLEKNMGVKSSEFKFFNKKVKGLRTSQLTILSGGTGSGKTTLLSQMSLDFCRKGVSTMWGSFEIKNQVLISSMLNQFSNTNLSKHPEKLEHYFGKFRQLPLHYMSFFGSTDIEKVFGTIEYAIEKYNISHIVIDTLQFLLSDQATGFEKFDLQDRVMARLRRIANQHQVHVCVVIHPRKTDEGEDLGLHSIFGTSKSVQEADNVWLIQQRQGFKIFQVKKNRFDGELGKVALGFDKGTKRFFQLSQTELQQLFKKSMTIDEIVESRKNATDTEHDLQEAVVGNNEMDDMFNRQRRRINGGNTYQQR